MTIGNFQTILGTLGNDPLPNSFFAFENGDYLPGSDLDIVYGLDGNDFLRIEPNFLSPFNSAILVGGRGNDNYQVDYFVVISDRGNSANDTISANFIGFNRNTTAFAFVDNERHLYAFDTTSDQYVLLLDWQATVNRIENFDLEGDEFYTYAEFEATLSDEVNNSTATNADFLGNFTWEQLQNDSRIPREARINLAESGLSLDTIDDDIQEITNTNSKFESTIQTLNPGAINGSLTNSDNSYIFEGETFRYDFYSLPSNDNIDQFDYVNITLSSSDFDPVLFVLDSKGNVLDVNDNSDDSLNSELTFQITTGEPLFISVESYNANDTGEYNLSVDLASNSNDRFRPGLENSTNLFDNPIAPVETIKPRDSLTGALTDDDVRRTSPTTDRDIYRDTYFLVDSDVGDRVEVTLESDFDNSTLAIFELDADGNLQLMPSMSMGLDNNFSKGTFNVDAGLDYLIIVENSSGTSIGDYTLSTDLI